MRSRKKILNATLELIESAGYGGVTVAAVAQGAGVTRQTVYSIFGTREELVSQAVSGLVVQVLGDIRARLDAADSAFEYVAELIVAGRAAVRDHPVLTTLLEAEHGNPLFDAGMIARARPIARELLSPLGERVPNLQPSLDDVVEIALRLGISVILFEDEAVRTDGDLRAFLARWLQPAMTPRS
ncbi:TetR/AcrR family transcriptional regulator [Rhodococcus sp. NPDC127528]|uniref:TetR/AcrR family transcriptional regulator n=1 Tax=unclassified Rhodococcus (in: high G+C Gram-positive bacteria) TaxID=192944 RepID=UPI0036373FDC